MNALVAGQALEVRDLGVRVGDQWVLSGLSAKFPRGQVVGVVGANGAGKSSLINTIAGVLRPARGRVFVGGHDMTGAAPWKVVASGVARTFQVGRSFREMSAGENVVIGLMHGRRRMRDRRAALLLAEETLERVGFTALPRALPGRLSVADEQRLELAKALALDPDVLLLDEVFAGQQPTEVEAGITLIRELRDEGMTILCVEHVMKIILAVSDQVLALHQGRTLRMGTPDEVLGDPRLIEVYLGGRHVYPSGR